MLTNTPAEWVRLAVVWSEPPKVTVYTELSRAGTGYAGVWGAGGSGVGPGPAASTGPPADFSIRFSRVSMVMAVETRRPGRMFHALNRAAVIPHAGGAKGVRKGGEGGRGGEG